MPTCAEVLARTLRAAGVTRMFGLPGGEVLDFLEAARREGIPFVLTRHEATAAFMADVTGQLQGRPGVCVSTLGPGAVNRDPREEGEGAQVSQRLSSPGGCGQGRVREVRSAAVPFGRHSEDDAGRRSVPVLSRRRA